MATDQPRIGRALRRAMERARLNQDQVAEALGVSRSAVNSWINDRAYPMNSIGALEDLLGVTLDENPQETLDQKLDRLERELAELRQRTQDGRGKAQPDKTNGDRRAS